MADDNDTAPQVDTNPAPPEGPDLREAIHTTGAADRVKALVAWWKQTRLARALARYGNCYGGLLSSGMALTTMLSLTAVLTVAITVFMAVLGGNDQLRTSFIESLNAALPGVLKTESNPSGLVNPNSLVQSNASSVTGVVALVIAAWSAVSLIGSLAQSIRSVFGLVALPENGLVKIGRNALGALGLGVGLLASAGLGIVVNVFGNWVNRMLHLGSGAGHILLVIATIAVSLVVDAAVLLLLVRFVAGVRVPKRDLVWGLALFAVASAVLRQLGTTAVGSVNGALLASATAVLTLILWINLVMRVLLLTCAWMANPPQAVAVNDPDAVHFTESPNFVTMSARHTLEWPHNAVTGGLQPVVREPDVPEDQDPLPEKD
ncbi:inner membrane protein YhjD [Acidipropionibacterium jensenii]|uniref:Inner membrane protein YhjD n=1 Tax=Acidipropionibacterium jensenii TaxID=1749 RepID=A0A3S4UQK7_9ACTN|nr:YihY/virulence factor BrkB family protein [Acidipropionibacterium jensenii]VEI02887.1 inner membrane protein YhjD [Acidipropionibacterium jensenii]